MTPLPSESSKRRDKEIYRLAEYIARHPGASPGDIIKKADAISATCRTSHFHYMTDAIAAGWIVRVGNTRATQYFVTPEFRHQLAANEIKQPVSRREKVRYNTDFLDDYEPNRTYYLSDAQRDALHTACPVGSFNVKDAKLGQEFRRFMTDLSHHSSAFEGVKVKYADTISFLEDQVAIENMSAKDAVILRNHHNAIRFIVENTQFPPMPGDLEVSEYETRNIHAFLSDGLLKDKRMQGRLRHSHVEIKDSSYIPPNQSEVIRTEFAKIMSKARDIADPYEQSLFLLVHIPYLQPFDDCNKRTARLVCNIPMLNSGILPVSWAEVDQTTYTDSLLCIYEKNATFGLSDVYFEACKRSFERFEISMKSRSPSTLEVTYAAQIQQAIHNRVLHNDRTLPRDIRAQHIVEFEMIVEDTLDAIRENDMVAAPYRLPSGAVQEWLNQETSATGDAPH